MTTIERRTADRRISPAIGEFAINEAQRLRDSNKELVAALEGLFEHCVMMHKHWGEGCNQREADAAQNTARGAIARATQP